MLVGNEKTTKDAFDLMHKIKKLHPVCIDGVPQMWHVRKGKGLSRAITTTNPFVPAEELFPRVPDVMVATMNDGPHNIRYCPGSLYPPDRRLRGTDLVRDRQGLAIQQRAGLQEPAGHGPRRCRTAGQALSKDREIQKLGASPSSITTAIRAA